MKFDFATVTWGKWHTGVFLDVNLSSLLTEGNLPAFAKQHEVRYRIFTSKRDKKIIQAHPAFKEASKIVPFEFIECRLDNVPDPIGMHHALWRRSIEDARKAERFILFVPPDVIWSRDAFGNIANHFTSGKKAVFITYMRVISETCMPAVLATYGNGEGPAIDISARDMVGIVFDHIHPLCLTYTRESPNFPIHPEFILWPIPGEGYLMRVLVREMFAYDPRQIDLNQAALPAHTLDPDEIHFVTDSDELFAISLAPLLKDLNWYVRPQKLDPIKVASWWLTYDSPANDLASAQDLQMHRSDMTEALWARASREADNLIARLQGSREILRIVSGMDENEDAVARQLAFLMLGNGKWSRLARQLPPSTFFVPEDATLVQWLADRETEIGSDMSKRAIWNLFREHTVSERLSLDAESQRVIETMSGTFRTLAWDGSETATIDDIRVTGPGREIGPHIIYKIAGVLPAPAENAQVAETRSEEHTMAGSDAHER